MNIFRAAAFVAVLFAAFPAFALDCDNAQTQADMNECAGQKFQTADADLNDTYAQVMDYLGDNEHAKDLLKDAQRAWVAFRDAECNFRSADTEGGSIHSMIVAECMTDLTEERSSDLSEYLDCPEGDVSCVHGN